MLDSANKNHECILYYNRKYWFNNMFKYQKFVEIIIQKMSINIELDKFDCFKREYKCWENTNRFKVGWGIWRRGTKKNLGHIPKDK